MRFASFVRFGKLRFKSGSGVSSRSSRRTKSGPTPLSLEQLESRTLLSAGVPDTTFGNSGQVFTSFPGYYAGAQDVAIGADGKIVTVASGVTSTASAVDPASIVLTRYNPDGGLDANFGQNGEVNTPVGVTWNTQRASQVAILPDGHILVGTFADPTGAGGTPTNPYEFLLARYNANGSLDSSFGNNGLVYTSLGNQGGPYNVFGAIAPAMAVQTDGKVLLGGNIGLGSGAFGMVRYNVDGTLDQSFGSGGVVETPWQNLGTGQEITALGVEADGTIVATGGNINGGSPFLLARYDSHGHLDASFGVGGQVTTYFPGLQGSNANALAIQPDGRILESGTVSTATGFYYGLVRHNTDGSPDTSFGTGGEVVTNPNAGGDFGASLAVQPDGRILLLQQQSLHTIVLARFNSDGSADASFGTAGTVTPQLPATVLNEGTQVRLQPDGRIVVVGATDAAAGSNFLLRYQGDQPPTIVTAPANLVAGNSFSVTITVDHLDGSIDTGYAGVIHFTSSDPQALLPPDYTFTSSDNGTHTFTGVVLKTAGSQWISPNGMASATIAVLPAAATLKLVAPKGSTLGRTLGFTVSDSDSFGNNFGGYTGTVHFTSTDGAATLPVDYTFIAADQGAHTFTATLNTLGSQTITATDTVTSSMTTSAAIAVYPKFTVFTTCDSGDGSLRQAIADVNADPTDTAANPDVISFNVPANDPNHFYYKDNGGPGISLADKAPALDKNGNPVTNDADLLNPAIMGAGNTVDPDYPYSWWSIPVLSLLSINAPMVINGYTQTGASQNTLPNGDNAILRIELNGSLQQAVWFADDIYAKGGFFAGNGSTFSGLVVNGFDSPDPAPLLDPTSGKPIHSLGFSFNTFGPGGNVLTGNFIGTDISGTLSVPNALGPLLQTQYDRVGINPTGPTNYGERNIISGNRIGGVTIGNVGAAHNVVTGNLVGTNRYGNPLGNGVDGVFLYPGSNANQIGGDGALGNVIAYNGNNASSWGFTNGGPGVVMPDLLSAPLQHFVTTGNQIIGNSIHDNAGLGIDLGGGFDRGALVTPEDWDFITTPDSGAGVTINDSQGHTGPNSYQDFPVLTSVTNTATTTTVAGTLDTRDPNSNHAPYPNGLNYLPNATFRIDFFSNADPGHSNTNDSTDLNLYGEGQTFLGSYQGTTDANGHLSFTAAGLSSIPSGQGYVCATATNLATGETSEFSAEYTMSVSRTAHISNPLSAGPNQARFTFTASAPSAAEQAGFTYMINWGDGTATQTIAPIVDNGSGVSVNHFYSSSGTYLVQMTATDKDGNVSPTANAVFVNSNQAGDGIKLTGGTSVGQVAINTTYSGSLSPSPGLDQVLVSGQGGSDVYTVTFGSTLTTPITISGGGSSSGDKLVVNGDNSNSNIINKTSGQITWGNPVIETVYRTGIPNTTINANGTSHNYVNDPGGNTIINGGPGANTITVTATTGNGVVINGGPSSNTYNIDLGSLAAAVTVNNNNATAANSVVVNGAAGNNAITASGSQVTAGTQTINLNVSAPLTNLTINGGSGNNQITVSNLTTPVQNLAVNGGGGNNTITLINVGSSVSALTVTGSSTGTNQVRVQGNLPATVQAANAPPLVSVGGNITLDQFSTFTDSGSFIDTSAGASFAATVDYGDGSGPQALTLNANHSFALSHVYAQSGIFTVTVNVTDSQTGLGTAILTVSARPSIYVLNAHASAALSLSGNASIQIPGRVVVDSDSRTALAASGNVRITASAIQIVGGVKASGGATLSPTPVTGAAAVANPLAFLSGPTTAGLTNYGAAGYSGNGSFALNPGIYKQISVSGNASVKLNPGLYLIEGGGLTVTGNASMTGAGVMIYNTSSNYPNAGGNFGGITLSGNGTFSLSAATSSANGADAGIVIFQPTANTRALSVSGNGVGGIRGTVYAPSAQVILSGNAVFSGSLVADELALSGNGVSTQTADGVAVSPIDNSAGTLLAGNLWVYVSDLSGAFTSDEMARIADAIGAWNNLLTPYSVTITEVSDSSRANVVIDTGPTSAAGSAADGVLGAYSSSGEITLLQGWNWYAGADGSAITASQYDFQTVVTHELGHALGLGGSPDPSSPMYEVLASGAVRRTPATSDLNIPAPPEGADPERAAALPVGENFSGMIAALVRECACRAEVGALISPTSANASISLNDGNGFDFLVLTRQSAAAIALASQPMNSGTALESDPVQEFALPEIWDLLKTNLLPADGANRDECLAGLVGVGTRTHEARGLPGLDFGQRARDWCWLCKAMPEWRSNEETFATVGVPTDSASPGSASRQDAAVPAAVLDGSAAARVIADLLFAALCVLVLPIGDLKERTASVAGLPRCPA